MATYSNILAWKILGQRNLVGNSWWGPKELLEEEMATYSNILAWEILWTDKPGGLQSTGPQKSQT